MAESNIPKQDFAPPWLKFPNTDTTKSPNQKPNHQGDRNRQRREDPYSARTDYSTRLHRQSSFDFHEGKRFPQGHGKYRHHSVDDDYYGYPYGYGYYPSNYNFEKFDMQYSSQPSLARAGNRDGKYQPARFSQVNGPQFDLFEPYYQQGSQRRGHYDKEHSKDSRDEAKARDRNGDLDRPYSDDFPSLNGSGESHVESKPPKPGSGVWENPPKSSRNEDSPDPSKGSSPGIYKALVPSKGGQAKKPAWDGMRMNGNGVRDSSPLSPSNKPNHKEGTRQSPTPDLAIVTQPKKLGDKKSEFLRALRNESTVRSGDQHQSMDQKQESKEGSDSPMSEEAGSGYMNGDGMTDSNENMLNGKPLLYNGVAKDSYVNGEGPVNGETLIEEVDHISLSGEEEEKRLLLSMGWVEEDNTEYVITDDEIREFQNLVQNHSQKQNGLKTPLRNALNRKFVSNGMLNGTPSEEEESDTIKHL